MAEPQAKRPRYSHTIVPDGFQDTDTKPKSQKKFTIPKFTSTFETQPSSPIPIVKLQDCSSDLPEQSNSGTRGTPKAFAPLRPLKPPAFLLADQGTAGSRKSTDGIRLKGPQDLRARILPENAISTALPLPSSKDINSAPVLSTPLKALPTLPSVYLTRPETKSHHLPLSRFIPIIDSSKNSPRDTRTISTTHIALATDLSTENGAAEVASIFLQDQHSTGNPSVSDPELANMERSLTFSPEKAGKNKGSLFIKNGIAARACSVFNESRTFMSLWRKETELHSRRLGTADLNMLIVKILHPPALFSYKHPQISNDVATVFALCTPAKCSSKRELLRVFFTFPPTESNRCPCDLLQFEEGKTAHIWSPWQESAFQEEMHLDHALPASLPMPSSSILSTTDLTHLPLSKTVLFFSRFVVLPTVPLLG